MSLTPEAGQRSARAKAKQDSALYSKASSQYGTLLSSYRGEIPVGISVAHLILVNPTLDEAPLIKPGGYRGLMQVTPAMCHAALTSWDNTDEPAASVYTWEYALNAGALAMYKEHMSEWDAPNEDFWKCAYIRQILGGPAFDILWSVRSYGYGTVAESLVYAVNNLSRPLPGWSMTKLKKALFLDCAYVFELAKRSGAILSEKFGMPVRLNQKQLKQVYN